MIPLSLKAVIIFEVNMELNVEQMIAEDDELIVPMSIEYREDITSDDFKELCRLCGNCSNQLMPIFAGDGLDHDLSGKIKEYLPISVSLGPFLFYSIHIACLLSIYSLQISCDDDLPSNICYQCASTLISWHELYYACKAADQRLKELSSRLPKLENTIENVSRRRFFIHQFYVREEFQVIYVGQFEDVLEDNDYGEDVTDSIFVQSEVPSEDVDENATKVE